MKGAAPFFLPRGRHGAEPEGSIPKNGESIEMQAFKKIHRQLRFWPTGWKKGFPGRQRQGGRGNPPLRGKLPESACEKRNGVKNF